MSLDESTTVQSDQESAATPLASPGAEMLFGAGQSAWLALVSVGVLVALAVSFVALFMAVDARDDGGTVTAPTGPATELAVEAKEFGFTPGTATILADTDVAVALTNAGAVEHNWTVLEAGTTIGDEAEFDEALVAASIAAAPGESVSDTVNLPAGSYQVICSIAGHFSAGMEGTLEVAS